MIKHLPTKNEELLQICIENPKGVLIKNNVKIGIFERVQQL